MSGETLQVCDICAINREEIWQARAGRMSSSGLSAAWMQGPAAGTTASHSQRTQGTNWPHVYRCIFSERSQSVAS